MFQACRSRSRNKALSVCSFMTAHGLSTIQLVTEFSYKICRTICGLHCAKVSNCSDCLEYCLPYKSLIPEVGDDRIVLCGVEL